MKWRHIPMFQTSHGMIAFFDILPVKGIPHVELVKKYIRPLTLIKLLPGNFNTRQALNVKIALHDVVSLLRATLGFAKNEKLQTALDALTSELTKIDSNVILQETLVNSDDIKSIIEKIPFKQYKQLELLKAKMTI